jgi:RNA polymerase sigma factor (sigma-70 family)
MNPSIGSENSRHGFASTQWSLVLAARDGEPLLAHAALSSLCAIYWRPLYSFVRGSGYPAEDAQDLTQSFFAHLLEKHALAHVDPSFGKFRSFLLASIKNFLTNEWRRGQAIKRGGAVNLVSLDEMAQAERVWSSEPSQSMTPERAYERGWALSLLGRVATRLEAEFSAAGKGRIFEHLKPYLTGDGSARYAEVASSLQMNEVTVRVAVHRMRGRFRDLLQQEISQTLSDPGDSRAIEEELRFLLTVL